MDWKYLQKCQLFRKDLQYMSNTIFIPEKRVCIRPLHSRLEAIQRLRPPTTVKDCRSFEGMENFLSIFCQDLQKLLKPIYDLTRKERQFIWGQEQHTVFDEIKSRLQKPLVLHFLMAMEDSFYIQILVNMPWAVPYIRYRMVCLS